MTYSTHIAAAKRLARKASRENGSSYQTELENIARSSGRSDWTDFVASPTEPSEHLRTEDPGAIGREGPSETCADSVNAACAMVSRPMLVTLAGLAFVALVLFLPLREENLTMMVIGSQIAIALLLAGLIATASCGATVLYGRRDEPRRWMDRSMAVIIAVASFQTGATAMSSWAMIRSPEWRISVPGAEAAKVEDDRMESDHIRFVGWDRDIPVATTFHDNGNTMMTVVLIDDRIRPARRDRPLHIGDRMGGRKMQEAMVSHPVFRIRGRVDCVHSTFKPQSFELADSYRAATMVHHAYDRATSSRGFEMRREDAARICSA
jgi:hypothetical protein